MKRASALLVTVLLAALLSACGAVGTPAAPGAGLPSGRVQSAAIPPPGSPAFPAIRVVAAVLEVGSRSVVTASLNFSAGPASTGPDGGLTAQAISVSVESAPPGVNVRPLPMSSGTGGPGTGGSGTGPELTLPIEVRTDGIDRAAGTGAGQADIWLNVRQGAQSLRVRLPLLWVSKAALSGPAGIGAPGGSFQAAATVPCGPDIYVFAPLNAPLERRTRLLRKTVTQTGTESAVQSYDLGLAPTEGVTSLLCDPSGAIWMTLHSGGAQGSVIARFVPESGQLTRYGADAAGDTLNNLTRTPDGRLWFVQYKRDRLGEFDPRTGRVSSHAVAENAENLRLGQDGALYYSQFYDHPAVVRYDPATGSSTVMGAGTSGRNLPRAVVQTGGAVWYVDAWTQALVRIDPAGGQLTAARLPAGAIPGELVAAPDGTLWVSDAAAHVLYRLAPGSLEAVTVPLGVMSPGAGGSDGPRALSVDDGGRLWYESGGQLIGQW